MQSWVLNVRKCFSGMLISITFCTNSRRFVSFSLCVGRSCMSWSTHLNPLQKEAILCLIGGICFKTLFVLLDLLKHSVQ